MNGKVPSASTDKLELINDLLEQFPKDKIKSIEITWKEIGAVSDTSVICPNVKVILKD